MRLLLLLLDGMLAGMLAAARAELERLPRRDARRAELRETIARLEEGRAWIAGRLAREDGVDDLRYVLLAPLMGVYNYSVGGGVRRLAGLWARARVLARVVVLEERCTTGLPLQGTPGRAVLFRA